MSSSDYFRVDKGLLWSRDGWFCDSSSLGWACCFSLLLLYLLFYLLLSWSVDNQLWQGGLPLMFQWCLSDVTVMSQSACSPFVRGQAVSFLQLLFQLFDDFVDTIIYTLFPSKASSLYSVCVSFFAGVCLFICRMWMCLILSLISLSVSLWPVSFLFFLCFSLYLCLPLC